MTYVKQTWVNGPAGLTPISATRLNHIEDGIDSSAQIDADESISGDWYFVGDRRSTVAGEPSGTDDTAMVLEAFTRLKATGGEVEILPHDSPYIVGTVNITKPNVELKLRDGVTIKRKSGMGTTDALRAMFTVWDRQDGFFRLTGPGILDGNWDAYLVTGSAGIANGTTTYTSATPIFTADMVGKAIKGWQLQIATTVAAYVSPTEITLSTAAVGSGSGLPFTVGSTPNNALYGLRSTNIAVDDGVRFNNWSDSCVLLRHCADIHIPDIYVDRCGNIGVEIGFPIEPSATGTTTQTLRRDYYVHGDFRRVDDLMFGGGNGQAIALGIGTAVTAGDASRIDFGGRFRDNCLDVHIEVNQASSTARNAKINVHSDNAIRESVGLVNVIGDVAVNARNVGKAEAISDGKNLDVYAVVVSGSRSDVSLDMSVNDDRASATAYTPGCLQINNAANVTVDRLKTRLASNVGQTRIPSAIYAKVTSGALTVNLIDAIITNPPSGTIAIRGETTFAGSCIIGQRRLTGWGTEISGFSVPVRSGLLGIDQIVSRATADLRVIDTTQTDIPGLSYALAANENRMFEAILFYDSTTANDFRVSVTAPSGCIINYSTAALAESALSSSGNMAAAVAISSGTVLSLGGARASGAGVARVMAVIRGITLNGSTAGTVQVRMSKRNNTDTATPADDATVYTNSYLIAQRM